MEYMRVVNHRTVDRLQWEKAGSRAGVQEFLQWFRTKMWEGPDKGRLSRYQDFTHKTRLDLGVLHFLHKKGEGEKKKKKKQGSEQRILAKNCRVLSGC